MKPFDYESQKLERRGPMCRRTKWFLTGLLPLVIILTVTGWGDQARSQEKYPTRAIDIIVSYAPGGGVDLSARVLSCLYEQKMGFACECD